MKIKLIALFIMMRSLAAIADNDTYFFSKVDYQQGLSNSAVLCLFQDNVGLMWFGTYDGVGMERRWKCFALIFQKAKR